MSISTYPVRVDASPEPQLNRWRWPVTMVLGSLAFVVAGGLLAAGATAAVLQATLQDDAGFFMSAEKQLQTSTYAITAHDLETNVADGALFVPKRLVGEAKVTVTPLSAEAAFVGIAPTEEVEAYLADVAHTIVADVDTSGVGGGTVFRDAPGAGPGTAPADAMRWTAQTSGSGTQDLIWALEDGDWTVVAMNADGSPGVAVDVTVGAEFPALGWAIAVMLVLGGCLLLVSSALIRGAPRVPERPIA